MTILQITKYQNGDHEIEYSGHPMDLIDALFTLEDELCKGIAKDYGKCTEAKIRDIIRMQRAARERKEIVR